MELTFEQLHEDIVSMLHNEAYHNREVNSILIGYDQRHCILSSQKCYERHLYWSADETKEGQARYRGIPLYVVDRDDHLSVGYQSTTRRQQ